MPDSFDPFSQPLSRLAEPALQADETDSYGAVLRLLRQREGSAVLICRQGRLCGILTERDVLDKLVLEKVPPETPVGRLMTPSPVSASPSLSVARALRLMHAKHVRNLPVLERSGRPLGLVSAGRLIRHLADHFPAEIVNLPPKPEQVTGDMEGA